jgi:HAD superfamily hydrolase (TIGR01490 family)
MIAALFDSDGTLYAAQFGRGMMKYAQTHGRSGQAWVYFASLLPSFLASKFSPAAREVFERERIARLAWLLKGWDEGEVMAAFHWVAHEYLLPTRRAAVLRRLAEHQLQEHRVLIVSGMFTACLEVIGRQLGVIDLIGTELEMEHGRCSGKIIPPVIKGAEKIARTRQYLESRGIEVDWQASYAYGDSFSDRDMLSLAGNPAAVYPDEKLRRLAQQRGWEILED